MARKVARLLDAEREGGMAVAKVLLLGSMSLKAFFTLNPSKSS